MVLDTILTTLSTNAVFIIAGLVGGLARSFFGLYKSVTLGNNINKWHFIIGVVASGIIGGILGVVLGVDYRFSALAGFVGTDILENVLEGSMKKNIALQKAA